MKTINLTKGHFTIVDDSDYECLSQYSWYYTGGYARKSAKNGERYMHRIIAGVSGGLEVDHKNRNRLDNRRQNLRICTRIDNVHNSSPHKYTLSGVRGVSRAHNKSKLWKAEICFDGVRKYLGCFKTKELAAAAYRTVAKKLHGDFYAS